MILSHKYVTPENPTEDWTSRTMERFTSSFSVGSREECWIWTGATSNARYPVFGISRTDGIAFKASPALVTWHLYRREPIQVSTPHFKLTRLPICPETRCVNPFHRQVSESKGPAIGGGKPDKDTCRKGHDLRVEGARSPRGRCVACLMKKRAVHDTSWHARAVAYLESL